MTEQAAVFQAVYADFRMRRTRSVVEIVFEVPLEQSDHAYQVLGGLPSQATSSWFAIARLVNGTTAVVANGHADDPLAIPDYLRRTR